jgi:hypothetical protein
MIKTIRLIFVHMFYFCDIMATKIAKIKHLQKFHGLQYTYKSTTNKSRVGKIENQVKLHSFSTII